MTRPRVAIAHDYLTQRGGAERVVLALARAFPDAPIHTTLYSPDDTYPEFRDLDVRPSRLNRVGPLRRSHRAALPLLPLASSSISIDADVVVASSSGWAHGFRTTGRTLVFCHSPARWLYEPDMYLGDDASRPVRLALGALRPALLRWDRRAAARADRYLAVSQVTRARIERAYGFSAPVVPSPHSVDVDRAPDPLPAAPAAPGYFLVVSRLLEYKNVREIVRAFAGRPERLVVVGAGPQKPDLQRQATANVTFREGLTDDEMFAAYEGCAALVAASHEDFGLTPLEAAAHGKPAIVLRWGGFLETVIEGETGVFFDEPEPGAIAAAVDAFGARSWDAARLRARADDFSEAAFARSVRAHVDELWSTAQSSSSA